MSGSSGPPVPDGLIAEAPDERPAGAVRLLGATVPARPPRGMAWVRRQRCSAPDPDRAQVHLVEHDDEGDGPLATAVPP